MLAHKLLTAKLITRSLFPDLLCSLVMKTTKPMILKQSPPPVRPKGPTPLSIQMEVERSLKDNPIWFLYPLLSALLMTAFVTLSVLLMKEASGPALFRSTFATFSARAVIGTFVIGILLFLSLFRFIFTFVDTSLALSILSYLKGQPLSMAATLWATARRTVTLLQWSVVASLLCVPLFLFGKLLGSMGWRQLSFFIAPSLADKNRRLPGLINHTLEIISKSGLEPILTSLELISSSYLRAIPGALMCTVAIFSLGEFSGRTRGTLFVAGVFWLLGAVLKDFVMRKILACLLYERAKERLLLDENFHTEV